jgi:prepilin-type processing-associated H-X9-DG protein
MIRQTFFGNGDLRMTDSYGDPLNTRPIYSNSPISMSPHGGAKRDFNKDNANNDYNIRFRHMRDTQANALMVDGHVESFALNNRKVSDMFHATDMKELNIGVNP